MKRSTLKKENKLTVVNSDSDDSWGTDDELMSDLERSAANSVERNFKKDLEKSQERKSDGTTSPNRNKSKFHTISHLKPNIKSREYNIENKSIYKLSHTKRSVHK